MPEPRAVAVGIMSLLAFGVVVGALTGPTAQSAGIAPIVLYTHEAPAPAPAPVAEEAEDSPQAPTVAPVVTPAPAAVPLAPLPPTAPAPGPVPKEKLVPEVPEATLPPIRHVFLIVLPDQGYEEAFGPTSPMPYLAQTLRGKGELLANYYSVTQGDLANEIALLSGQGPNPATAVNCPEYEDISPGALSSSGQVEGEGCVYPATVESLPSQLIKGGETWKAYIEGIADGKNGEPTSCRHPLPGAIDEAQAPRPEDSYETWRNPFVYFHSIVDSPECGERDVGLEQLAADLRRETSTPSFSYIAASQPQLETLMPQIEASPAFRKDGLIAITSAQGPQDGPEPDRSACCGTPEYPNLPPPPAPPVATADPVKEVGGGGRVGMLLISPFVEPGSTNESGYYNHYSFLLSVGELLGLPQPLGYAADPALTAFDETVYVAGDSPSAASPRLRSRLAVAPAPPSR